MVIFRKIKTNNFPLINFIYFQIVFLKNQKMFFFANFNNSFFVMLTYFLSIIIMKNCANLKKFGRKTFLYNFYLTIYPVVHSVDR